MLTTPCPSRHLARRAAVGLLLVACSGPGQTPPAPAPDTAPTPSLATVPADATVAADVASHRRMVADLAQLRAAAVADNPFVGEADVRKYRARLADLPADANPAARWWPLVQLGEAEVRIGRLDDGIAHLREAESLIPADPGLLGTDVVAEFHLALGVSYLRLAETRNCCARHAEDSCLLPIRGSGVHQDTYGSSNAVAHFTTTLERTAPGSRLHLQARWLLNIAHMTLGQYPDKVEPRYLIPPAAYASEAPFPRLRNIARPLGLDAFSLSGSVIADDFDGDGRLDLMVSSYDPASNVRFHRNVGGESGDGAFADRTAAAGLNGITGGLNMVQADYDNDGDLDFLILRGAWWGASGRQPNSLVRNDGDGTFTDVTYLAGLGQVAYPTQTAAWADYDNDGDLDLYVGNETSGEVRAPCQLWRNDGNGTFSDVAVAAGVDNNRFAKSVHWGDYDGDRWPDLYVSNLGGANRLYHNNRDGTFLDVARLVEVTEPLQSFPAWFWDFDNDGALDLFVSTYGVTIDQMAAAYLGDEVTGAASPLPRLYRGDGRGNFREVGRQLGLVRPSYPMGSNFGDIDNDGFLDMYLGTGNTEPRDLVPNVLYRNDRGRRFLDVGSNAGLSHLQKGHGIAFADLDHDGDPEIFEQMGGAYLGDKYYDALYLNPGFGNHWLAVELEGVQSNRSGIGARIRVDIVEDGARRSIYRTVNSGATFGANPLRQTVGLGRAARIEALEVWWPTSDSRQLFADVGMDQFVRIVEGAAAPETIERPPFALGPAR